MEQVKTNNPDVGHSVNNSLNNEISSIEDQEELFRLADDDKPLSQNRERPRRWRTKWMPEKR